MKNEKLKKLFGKVRERLEGKEPSYTRIHISSPSKEVEVQKFQAQKGSKVHHPEHGHGEVKAMLHGGKYASVKFGDGEGSHYKPVKIEELKQSEGSKSRTKLGQFMAKAKVDDSLSIKGKQEAREARHWRTPHWVSADPKAKIPAEIPHENYTNKEGILRAQKQRHDGTPKWEPNDSPKNKGIGFTISDAERGVHHRGEYLEGAKSTHKKKLAELKSMPKPNLPKSEMGKAEKDSVALQMLRDLLSKKELRKKMAKASPENMTSAQLQGIKVPQPKAPKMTQKPIQNRPQMPKPKMGGGAGMKMPKMKVK